MRIGVVKSAGLKEVVQLRLKSIVACCHREAIGGRTVTATCPHRCIHESLLILYQLGNYYGRYRHSIDLE